MDECINSIIQRLPFISNDYLLTSYVGKGAYSVVFQAVSPRYQGKLFAAKVSALDPIFLSEDGLHEAELEALTQLIHPNIIKVYDYVITTTSNLLYESYKNRQNTGKEPPSDQEILDIINAEAPGLLESENYYLVLILDYCENGTLSEMFGINESSQINDGANNLPQNSFEQSLYLFSNIVDALSYCHSKGISHGDLKPSNIFVNQYNRAIVADFGLASFYTNSIDIMRGTPYYCAPEIFNEGISYDPFLADIFALGVTSYQFFTGSLPFTEDQLRNGKIDESEIKVVFPGYENDYKVDPKKDKKNRFSLNITPKYNINSNDAESNLSQDLQLLNNFKRSIHSSRANDDFKLFTSRTASAQNSESLPKTLSLAPTLAATTAISHPTVQAKARSKKRRAVLPEIITDPSSNSSDLNPHEHRPILNHNNLCSPTFDFKSGLVKPKVGTPTYAPRVSSFFYDPKERTLANFFGKEGQEEEEEDEFHDFTSPSEMKQDKSRFEVRMALADLIRKMLAKLPEERPLMAEINYKTKSLITKWNCKSKNISQCPGISRVLSATTSVTNFLLAARHKAAKEKEQQELTIKTSREAQEHSAHNSSNNSRPLSEQSHQRGENQIENLPQTSHRSESAPNRESYQTENNQDGNCDDPSLMQVQARDRCNSQMQSAATTRPLKASKTSQLVPSVPIIKQPCSRSRSSRRSMKVSSVNLSGFTTKVTQKNQNVHSQPNYMLKKQNENFSDERDFSDTENRCAVLPGPLHIPNNQITKT